MRPNKGIDIPLLISVILLVVIGIIMVFSSSYSYALIHNHDGAHYLKRVLLWSVLGAGALVFCSYCPYRLWARFSNAIMVVALMTLVAVLTPLGKEVNHAQRWLEIAGINIMPSEIAKVAIIIYMAAIMEKNKYKLKNFREGFAPHLIMGGIVFVLVYQQPDFSTGLIILSMMMMMLFVSGVNMVYYTGILFSGTALAASALIYIFMSGQGYKARRLVAYIDPWSDPLDAGLQTVQSLLAIGSGGLAGRGIGRSIQKHLYLPEPQNDFIFAIIGEEVGFIGASIVVLLFGVYIWRGTCIAINAPDMFSCLTATGITSMIAIQVIVNVGVATSLLPVTGIPLPFISYGGSSLLMMLACTGILLNISRYSEIQGG
ncbi:putative lipid II flippase FtsW [Tindallia californiensis]|uniref:Probable peptidoglycan glycosyltransferase FtsW n=1 Tax=Tindallia californiensis TaxID=159292 RepID=A0A1H3JRL6_9FIRM|nr:putative lipid II flippase FtsW [Tindallia californiensis]SDY41914.1 cell division protein FtsW [Tindallia californiensis]